MCKGRKYTLLKTHCHQMVQKKTEQRKKYLHWLVIVGKIKHTLRPKVIKRKLQGIEMLSQDDVLPLLDKL